MFYKQNIKILGIFTALALLLFSWLFKYGYFFSDDFTWLWQGAQVNIFAGSLFYKMSTYYSPVMNFIFYLWYHIFGYGAWAYFVFSLLVHILTSFGLYLLLSKIQANYKLAFWGALFFLIAGASFEPILWIAANLHMVAAMFIVYALYFYWCFLEKVSNKFFIWTVVFFILALCTKEISFITGPLLFLTFIFFQIQHHNKTTNKVNIILLAVLFILTMFYGLSEYFWQHNSSAVSSGYWQLDFSQLIRCPVIVVDLFIPMFSWVYGGAHYLYFWSAALVALLIYYFHRSQLFWFGLLFALTASLPTIFAVDDWWMPLASRYTYLPKIGAVIILVVVLEKIIQYQKKIIYPLLLVLFIYNLAYWVYIAAKEYPYVYQSGRSLVQVARQMGERQPAKIYWFYPFPFNGNEAHVYGALMTLANISKERVVFVSDTANFRVADIEQNSLIVSWQASNNSYTIK